ncbi:hypothetical protein F750_6799 [Streptomyces sp. PAMC 26508]|nr:hypothetical protein F750_6799 [Streptomyces sp. PAMC 26508]
MSWTVLRVRHTVQRTSIANRSQMIRPACGRRPGRPGQGDL